MRIRVIRFLLTALVVSIAAVGTLTACGSSMKPASGSTPPAATKNADGCPAGTTIPQGGGDQDTDNSGGPSDGDGCL